MLHGCGDLSLERIVKAFVDLGFSRIEAEIYVYLAKKGSKTVTNLTKALISNKADIYCTLAKLQTKGLVTNNGELYSAIPFKDALELLIEIKKEQAQAIQESKEELLATWETKD
jgi:sugar-specific transcriptional regulator TrmB